MAKGVFCRYRTRKCYEPGNCDQCRSFRNSDDYYSVIFLCSACALYKDGALPIYTKGECDGCGKFSPCLVGIREDDAGRL